MSDTFIGTVQRLDAFSRRDRWPKAEVRISYMFNGERQVITICPEGARTLAKALKHNADLADPPRKRQTA